LRKILQEVGILPGGCPTCEELVGASRHKWV